jgi:hypothetical protein
VCPGFAMSVGMLHAQSFRLTTSLAITSSLCAVFPKPAEVHTALEAGSTGTTLVTDLCAWLGGAGCPRGPESPLLVQPAFNGDINNDVYPFAASPASRHLIAEEGPPKEKPSHKKGLLDPNAGSVRLFSAALPHLSCS